MRKADMLRSLVKKFKSHNLEEGGVIEVDGADGLPPAGTPPPQKVPRLGGRSVSQSATHKASHSHNQTGRHASTQGHRSNKSAGNVISDQQEDSGTESDEHEQCKGAKGDTVSVVSAGVSQTSDYYASQQSLSLASGSFRSASPTALSQFSDIDTNSRDSMGCESGIVIGRGSCQSSDTEQPSTTPTERLYEQNHIHANNMQLLGHNRKLSVITNAAYVTRGHVRQCREQEALAGSQQSQSTVVAVSPCASPGGAFQPVALAEKRKWQDGTQSPSTMMLPKLTFAHFDDTRRETLTAARRMPVRLVIGSPAAATIGDAGIMHISNDWPTAKAYDLTDDIDELSLEKKPNNKDQFSSSMTMPDSVTVLPTTTTLQSQTQTMTISTRRTGGPHRPSLDFNKMRERMVKPGHGSRKHDGFRTRASSKGWSGVLDWKTDCVQSDCLFRPVVQSSEPTTSTQQSPTKDSTNEHNDDDVNSMS